MKAEFKEIVMAKALSTVEGFLVLWVALYIALQLLSGSFELAFLVSLPTAFICHLLIGKVYDDYRWRNGISEDI